MSKRKVPMYEREARCFARMVRQGYMSVERARSDIQMTEGQYRLLLEQATNKYSRDLVIKAAELRQRTLELFEQLISKLSGSEVTIALLGG